MRQYALPILLTLVLLSLLVLSEIYRPITVDWRETYQRKDKIPFGCFAVYDMLTKDVFEGQEVYTVNQPVYNQVKEWEEAVGDAAFVNYVFIGPTYEMTDLDVHHLLDFTYSGNNVFISSPDFPAALADSLGLSVDFYHLYFGGNNDTLVSNFVDPVFCSEEGYTFKRLVNRSYFEKEFFKFEQTRILGENDKGLPNFIAVKHGNGELFLHASPKVFTNYNLLDSKNNEYISKSLSFLPVADVLWDEYYKVGRDEGAGSTSPMRYIHSQRSLYQALLITLGGVLLFMLFKSKREQRIIPVIPPVKNTSLEFAETVGRLYYHNGDHRDIAAKKISYFYDYLRRTYYFDSIKPSEDFFKQLSGKSGVPQKNVANIFAFIKAIKKQSIIIESDLMYLNRQIEAFIEESK